MLHPDMKWVRVSLLILHNRLIASRFYIIPSVQLHGFCSLLWTVRLHL